jgi:hypothetical protein
MPDREKVIEEFEHLLNAAKGNYQDFVDLTVDGGEEVLALLKKQEATMVIESENMYTGLPITHCPKCGKLLDRYLYGRRQEGEINFCPYCGQEVKWE